MHISQKTNHSRTFSRTPLSAGIVLALTSPSLLAQDALRIEEITVTAQKREESMQSVPISIQALGNQQIEELNLQNFRDYVQMLPTVTMGQNTNTLSGSGFSLVYMRGISTANDGQATTSQPSVGMYLDELPITTIQGNLDVHMYDVARVEALAGPQGTLFGASSQAGTIRVITNKPDLSGFSGGFGVEGSLVDSDDSGYVVEGYVNLPIGDKAAVRLVGWAREDAGWIDNVAGSRTFPGVEDPSGICSGVDCSLDDITITNDDKAKDNYNTTEVAGARAALRVDLNDNWTATPTVMFQSAESNGIWGDDDSIYGPEGKYAVSNYQDDFVNDDWYMAGLTIEGKIGNLDVVYAGSYLDRSVDASFDYTDYSYFYDIAYSSGFYADLHFQNTGSRPIPNMFESSFPPGSQIGSRVMGGAYYVNDDEYTKQNHEIRISTDPDKRVRGMLGVFWQNQFHDFEQAFTVDGLGDVMLLNRDEPSISDWPGVVYLNKLEREDSDQAIFGHVSFDLTEAVELTIGARFFQPEVTVKGFFGFGTGFSEAGWSQTGEVQCNRVEGQDGWTPSFNGQADWKDAPCLNVDKGIDESENIVRVNLTWQLSDDHMVYGTFSEGYRPGGINRAPSAGEFVSDFLTNYELGWKTQWADNRVQFNGAVFLEEWDDFQVSFTGDNAITAVNNGPTAEVVGLEAQMLWLATENLTLSAAGAWYDTELQDEYCPDCDGPGIPWAPAGTKLPTTADFKGNLIARYQFPLGSFDAHLQGAMSYEGARQSDLNVRINEIRGEVPENTFVDLSFGIGKDDWTAELFIKNATDEDAPMYYTSQCGNPDNCGEQNYAVRARPRTVSLRFNKDFD
ncbi:MAG: TonB-dependent receptor [Gammaproteobacteria bacterium]|nr:TonB-dependent receptor [Gammaproteobacteria bacterium]